MSKISRFDALREVIIAADSGEIDKANEMMKIIMRTIDKDKNSKKTTEYIELQNKKEERLFEKIIKYKS